MITAFDRTQCLSAWAEEGGIGYATIRMRLSAGWAPEVAVTLPPGAHRVQRTTEGYSGFSQLKEVLTQYRSTEMVPVICTRCAAQFFRTKEELAKAHKNRHGIFCSSFCGAKYPSEKNILEVDGIKGKICRACNTWKVLPKIGNKRVCDTCLNTRPRSRYTDYKRHSKYGFALTFDEFNSLIFQACWYCGTRAGIDGNGIDRIDSLKGYSTDNCLPCCKGCNRSKSNHSQQEFLERCHRIAQRHPMESTC